MELPQEMAMASNATDNRNGRVHSLFTAPVLQKSLHISQNRGSGVSSARNLQEQSKTRHLPKDKDKESPGNRLLNMLRRTLKGSESKELEVTHETPKLVPFGGVVGCLAIHVKKCRRFTPKSILSFDLRTML
ncbi:C2 calcium dependent domain containing 6 [Rhinolophus ferrumequinum]|uniref:C2 calcium dependent domain containing 6 n=1 Tax=Rhinolophus ferrumequinum TaxID=59479 RepID=A0A7J7YGQ9_RHIFE|nr:C2 calcium dependent domain containing 6 [Rhinolophus ferrumequinum]